MSVPKHLGETKDIVIFLKRNDREGATHPMGNDANSRRHVGIASRAAVLGPCRQTGPQIGRISHRLLILGAGRLEGLAGMPIGVQSGNPVWRDGAALCGRAFRLLEDFATMADAVHLAAAVLFGFLCQGLRPTCGATECQRAGIAHEIHPGLVGQSEPFQDGSQAVRDGAPLVTPPGAATPLRKF